MKLVVLGLTLSSSWGNGHATTYRALLKAFAARGHDVLFLERDKPWYAAHRDLGEVDYCTLAFYDSVAGLERWQREIAQADAVIVGSYVPDGVAVGAYVQRTAKGVTAFYDIDTPVTLAKLERGDFEYLSPDLIPGYDLYLSFTGGPTLKHIERHYGSPAARALYCSVDSDVYRPRDAEKRWDLSYLGTYSPDRQPVLDTLLIEAARRCPERRFVVAGPQYPDDIDWPANVERIDHVPPADHPAFYAASRFTLNVTRADMVKAGWSPSVRLFEAGACGTAIISDRWAGLDRLFAPGSEIVLAESADDVIAALGADAAAVGMGARERTLAGHTAAHRAAELETQLAEAAGRKNKSRSRTMSTKKTALVAGGAGFIGSHICDRLIEDGFHVLCFDNLQTGREDNIRHLRRESRFDFVEGDVTDPLPGALTRSARSLAFVYDLACAASPPHYQADPEHTMLTNVVGASQLLRLAERAGARFLLSSTSEVYGDPEMHPQPESYRGWVNCTGPRACYDEGKRAAETLAFDFDRLGRAEVRVARIFNTYGPRMRPDDGRVVSNLICQALSGDDITIYGDGSQTRSFCYVDDLVEGLVRLSRYEGAQPGPINLGNPIELTVAELAERVIALTGSDAELVHRPLPVDDPRRRRPDIAKAKKLLSWRPEMGLEEGLEQTIAWFARTIERPRRSELRMEAVAAE
jgi:nucleoside-diphosphate-sugar epimerase/spore maturation protein CgeB